MPRDVRTTDAHFSVGAYDKITYAVLKTGEKVVFDEVGGRYVQAADSSTAYRVIVGVQANGTVVELPIDQVEELQLFADPTIAPPPGITSGVAVLLTALTLFVGIALVSWH